MREQKQRDKEEEKRRQEAAELKLINYIKQIIIYFYIFIFLEIIQL